MKISNLAEMSERIMKKCRKINLNYQKFGDFKNVF